jgi:neutral amino acid transport system ATP-binding protein
VTVGDGEVLLRVEQVIAGYLPDVPILNGVNLTVREGEIVTVVGPNGAGKSTLIKAIFGLLRPRQGAIFLRGEDISRRKTHEISRSGVSYVPQVENVFATLPVEENLELGAIARPRVDVKARIAAIYELFPGLASHRRRAAGTMSGGERQMLAMARALMCEPEILLLDEPSAGLSPSSVDAMFSKVEEVNAGGVTVLMVEQNARRALAMSDRGYVLELGRDRFEGPGQALLDDPKVAELYLGGARQFDGARHGQPAGR